MTIRNAVRVLHLADLHLRLTGPRADECRRILDWIADHAREVEPDVVVVAGDVLDRRSTPEERLFLCSWFARLAQNWSVVAIRGNHDDADDLRLWDGWLPTNLRVLDGPEVVDVRGVSIAALPWPRLGQLAASLPAAASIADRREAARVALLDILRGFRADPGLRPGAPSLLVAHMPVLGAAMDSGQPVSGSDEIALSADELLSCGAAGVALGHVHLRQEMRTADGRPVWFSGAPFRTTFGEAAGGKGGLIWDWTGDHWEVQEWNAPARRMVLLDGAWRDGQIDGPVDTSDLYDAEIRLRVEFPAEEREAVRREVEGVVRHLRLARAYSVTVEERPIVVQRTRCAEIAAARTVEAKVAAWAAATGSEAPPGALERLAQLEGEVAP